jgi:hypothetical protein
MKGLGDIFLKHSFDILLSQTFKDFNVVISDHSESDIIENLCKEYQGKLNISYYRNTIGRGSSSANINNAINKADGTLIKVLFQDDFLYHEKSLEEIVNAFDMSKDSWLVTACTHSKDGVHFFNPFYPTYNDKIYLGKNTISSPSVLTIKNDHPLLFDEKLLWLMDCDYYERCYRAFGAPHIVNTINVVNRVGDHQVTNTMVHTMRKIKELIYVIRKHRKYDRNGTI